MNSLIDPDGRAPQTVKPTNAAALKTIKQTVTPHEASYIRLDGNGNINTNLLSLCSTCGSENFQKLSLLANSETTYTYTVSSEFETSEGTQSFGPIKRDAEGNALKANFKGVTTVPGAEFDPSKDDNVNVYTNSGLEGVERPLNAGHELFGHAYLLEKGEDYLHRQKAELTYDADGNPDGIKPVESNQRLTEEINKSESAARRNYKLHKDGQ